MTPAVAATPLTGDVAIGTFEEIAAQIRNVRQLTSMSYDGVLPARVAAFAPVIPLLREERP